MSRAGGGAAADLAAPVNTTESLHLVALPDTNSLIVSSNDYPNSSVAILPEDCGAFQMICILMQMCGQGRNPLFRGKRRTAEPVQKIDCSIFIALLNFINPHIAPFLMEQLAQGVSTVQNISLTQITQIPKSLSVTLSGDDAALSLVTASSFFDVRAESLTCLLHASLNADLKTVRRVFEKTATSMLHRLLSTEHGTARAFTRLGRITVERTGTPLQMALYDNDEEMVALFKETMDPEEFEIQSKAAFATALSVEKRAELERSNASALDYYQAMQEQQNKDAKELCDGLKAAFTATRYTQFTVDDNLVASTTSQQLPEIIDAFINRLTDYVKNNFVHNSFILQRVYEIYDCLQSYLKRDCYFSQKVIGGVQSFLSARWLHHYAQGISRLAYHDDMPHRSFICRGSSNPHLDVRHLVSSCIGVDSFLSIFAGGCWASVRGRPAEQTLCLTKTASFQNLLRGERNRLTIV